MRLKKLRVSADLFNEVLREGVVNAVVWEPPFPADVRVVEIDGHRLPIGYVDLILESQEWPDIEIFDIDSIRVMPAPLGRSVPSKVTEESNAKDTDPLST